MVVGLLIAPFYVLNMEYTPGVSGIYAFLEAVAMDKPATAKKKISVQKLLSGLGLESIN